MPTNPTGSATSPSCEADIPGTLAVRERPPREDAGGGAALPFLLVHGSMDRASSFRRLEARLKRVPIITYDRRGYEGSTSRPVSVDFADQVADLLEVLAGRPVVALGHSYGGGVVLAAAQRHPDLIRSAVIWEPPMPWLPSWPVSSDGAVVLADRRDPAEVAESFMRRMVGDRVWERLPEATRRARRLEGVALVAEMRSLRGPLPWDSAAVTIPVIVGTGDDSRDHQRASAGLLAQELPNAHLAAVPGAGHGVHLSHPGDLAALLERAARLAAPDTPPLRLEGSGPGGVGTVDAGGAEWQRPSPDEKSPT